MTVIRTPDQRLRIFISSTMRELAEARAVARSAIERLRLIPVLFELGARPHPPRELYLAYLRQSDVFVGIYGQQYGWIAPDQEVSGLEDEYLNAGDLPKLVYVQSPAPDRDPRLTGMLDRIRSDGLSYRGFAEPGQLADLVADDLAVLLSERFGVVTDDRDDAVAWVPRSRLPAPATRFVGREHEMSTLRDLLTGDRPRLVTLAGPGGIGKTRLAMEVGTALRNDFEAVVVVELQEVFSEEMVLSSIAAALEIPESGERTLLESVSDHLRLHRMLLIVDNFEQVLGAAPVLGRLVAQASELVLLVTSRERLRIAGEWVVEVPPLTVPPESEQAGAARNSDAVALFVERARAAGRDRESAAGELRTIAEICRRLDGIPLAIELAASRARILGLDEILRRLDRSLSVLTGGPRDLPARHRTLRATIAWSYELLDDSDRRLLARLGVFAPNFGLAAAEQICTDEIVPSVLDNISSLVDKSLLQAEDTTYGQPRFTMLQVIREFALERLADIGDTDRLRRAHADYFERVVIATEPRLRSEPAPVVAEYRADQANLRAATRWLLEVNEGNRVARIAAAIWPHLWIAGLLGVSVDALQETLQEPLDHEPGPSVGERAHAWLGLGMLAFGQGDYERASPALEQAIELYEGIHDARGVATASIPLGVIRAVQQQNQGEDLLTRAAETFRDLDDSWGLANALLNLGGALLRHERYSEAIPPLEESVALSRAVHAEVFLSNALVNLGWAHHRLGDEELAGGRLSEAIKEALALDNRESLGRALEALGAVADAAGDPERGATLFGAAEGIRQSIGATVWVADRASHDDVEARLRGQLGQEAYRAAAERGRTLTLAQLLDISAA